MSRWRAADAQREPRTACNGSHAVRHQRESERECRRSQRKFAPPGNYNNSRCDTRAYGRASAASPVVLAAAAVVAVAAAAAVDVGAVCATFHKTICVFVYLH